MKRIKTEDGTWLHYFTLGEGVPIYFFHPPALGAAVFREQKSLANGHKLVALNARGHGLSEVGKVPLTIKRWAADAYDVTTVEKDHSVVLCGYSYGGLPALEFALSYPNRTKALILIGGFPVVDTLLLEREFQLGVFAASHHWQSLMAYVLSHSHTKHHITRKKIQATVRSVRSDVLRTWYSAGKQTDFTRRLHQLEVPLLLIYGVHDRYVQGYQINFYEQVTKGEVHTVYIDDVGHQVPTRRSKELNHIIQRFTERL
ncbi:alpha/beta fold hydrolase [Geomicrobium sediminis]|uniref:Pimeloyl-ACP methyl ester carboxylesterase n=1 Tax=Geomicrobium sediminis TaxID=1347788 RepID=A0ABS2P7S8_9BACL|nr:alpha/beta hydrolase [Geomicrobium sediminis]MBM7631473.1 pimeloyl-ACP methyl ester carboxylesterase [Geomicrobium sediminis]